MGTIIGNIRIITRNGDVMEYSSLRYEGDIIVEAGVGKLSGDTYIDGSHKTMIPGPFNYHVHPGMEVPGDGEGTGPDNETEFGMRFMRQCLEFPEYGVTCVRNMSTELNGGSTVRDVLEQEHYPAVRILASGRTISIMGGRGNLTERFDSADEVLSEARRKIKKNMGIAKFVVTGGMVTKAPKPGSVQYSVEELKPAVDEAKIYGKITGAHCTSLSGARDAILAEVRFIEHTQLGEETVELMMQKQEQGSKIFYCSTLIARYSTLHNTNPEFARLEVKAKPGDMERRMNAVRLCHERGIPTCTSTDTNAPFVHTGDVLDEVVLYTERGLNEMGAILAVTRDVARLCVPNGITGTLEVGRQADFVILSENPLDNIRNLELVEMTCHDG